MWLGIFPTWQLERQRQGLRHWRGQRQASSCLYWKVPLHHTPPPALALCPTLWIVNVSLKPAQVLRGEELRFLCQAVTLQKHTWDVDTFGKIELEGGSCSRGRAVQSLEGLGPLCCMGRAFYKQGSLSDLGFKMSRKERREGAGACPGHGQAGLRPPMLVTQGLQDNRGPTRTLKAAPHAGLSLAPDSVTLFPTSILVSCPCHLSRTSALQAVQMGPKRCRHKPDSRKTLVQDPQAWRRRSQLFPCDRPDSGLPVLWGGHRAGQGQLPGRKEWTYPPPICGHSLSSSALLPRGALSFSSSCHFFCPKSMCSCRPPNGTKWEHETINNPRSQLDSAGLEG